MKDWIHWWDVWKEKIFHAFTRFEAPQSNLAEVLHAGWKHRDKMGVSLLDCCYFDVRDSILLAIKHDTVRDGWYDGGYSPNNKELTTRKWKREEERASQLGEDLLDFGVTSRLTNPIKKVDIYKVDICNTPTCTCPDFQKNGKFAYCKHILFVMIFALRVEDEDKLNARHIGDEDVKSLLAPFLLKWAVAHSAIQKVKDCKMCWLQNCDPTWNALCLSRWSFVSALWKGPRGWASILFLSKQAMLRCQTKMVKCHNTT